MSVRPSGHVTFLFTDIEGSTRRWEQDSASMRAMLARHNALIQHEVTRLGGHVFKTVGDAFCVAFSEAAQAVAAAVAVQRALQEEDWQGQDPLQVRIALHAGTAHEEEGDYLGPPLNRVARLLSIAHGGQTLLSQAVRDLVDGTDALEGCELKDLGFHRLRDLLRPEHVYQAAAPGCPCEFPPLRSLDSLPNNLPRELSTLVGRDRELSQVRALLQTSSLVTLTGSGGSGKTRLAMLVGAEVLGERPDGVWFVDLAGLSDPHLVTQAICTQLGVRDPSGRDAREALLAYLRERDLLLILDNCEHLIDECARVAQGLLRACPKLAMLATSRQGLKISGEVLYPVPPLDLPPERPGADPTLLERVESVRLFCERAAAVSPGFQLNAHNAEAVCRICRRLDGIPLALELAAARTRVLTAQQIDQRLDNRFRLLTGGYRSEGDRHKTLRDAIDWSYDLLSPEERILLRRVAVFGGGWTLEAAEAVCPCRGVWHHRGPELALEAEERVHPDDVLDLLAQLVDRSLVVAEAGLELKDLPGPLAGGMRYRLLESIREYARERLAESREEPVLRMRHREYYAGLGEQAEAGLQGPDQARWLDVIQREMDNIRAALGWSVESESRLRLAGALWRYWYQRGPVSEGRAWLEGSLARSQGCSPEARARALTGAGNLAGQQGDYTAAIAHLEQCLALRREQKDLAGAAGALNNLGITAWGQGELSAAAGYLEEALQINRELGRMDRVAAALANLWVVMHQQGHGVEHRAWLQEAREIYLQTGDRWRLGIVLSNLGLAAKHAAEYEAAQAWYQEGLGIFAGLEEHAGLVLCLSGLGSVAVALGRPEEAVTLFAAEARLREEFGVPIPTADADRHQSEVRGLEVQLGTAIFQALWAAERDRPLADIVQSALDSRG